MKIWLIRHAKSSWAEPGLSDFERPLNDRGRRDGPRMATWLSKEPAPARWIWCSPARRAVETAEFVRQGFDLPEQAVVTEQSLYHATPEALLDVLRSTPSDVTSVALVAHNPGLTELVNGLGRRYATDNLPTFGIARFDFAGPWPELRSGAAELELLTSPKLVDA